MNLVDYPDSEGSDADVSAPAQKTAANKPPSKPTFQKVVDRANPTKIRVNLPTAISTAASTTAGSTNADPEEDARPAKKPRMGGGFNAMLPAPKKTGQGASGDSTIKKSSGLGRGVSLKTGAQPSFSRVPVDALVPAYEQESHNEPGAHSASETASKPEELKLVGKATMFKPLSVTNNKKKRKRTVAEIVAASIPSPQIPGTSAASAAVQSSPPEPKVSLFSMAGEETLPSIFQEATEPAVDSLAQLGDAVEESTSLPPQPQSHFEKSHINSVASIASDLKLSASERRQLFGRNGKNMPMEAINVVNFNTDEEWAANEAARASGDASAAIQGSRGVKAIAPGKHSLKQLVNAAVSQKEELEDHFLEGKRNRKEAGNKYGWT